MHLAPQLRDCVQGRGYGRSQRLGRGSGFRHQGHRILLVRALDDEPQPAELGVTFRQLGELLRVHEHAFDLGGLIGASHPAGDAHVGAAAGRGAGHHRREVAGREADHRIIRIERGDHHFADFARGKRIAGPRAHDLQEQVLVDDHPFTRCALVCDDAELGGGVALQHLDSAGGELLAQRRRERRA